MEQQFIVENIKCSGCSNSIRTDLLKIPKVEGVSVDIDAGSITITGNPDRNAVVAKLNDMGYPETGHNTLVKKAKSYVSCAIGKMTKE
jgi:copper chaperone CopZ